MAKYLCEDYIQRDGLVADKSSPQNHNVTDSVRPRQMRMIAHHREIFPYNSRIHTRARFICLSIQYTILCWFYHYYYLVYVRMHIQSHCVVAIYSYIHLAFTLLHILHNDAFLIQHTHTHTVRRTTHHTNEYSYIYLHIVAQLKAIVFWFYIPGF